MTKPELGHEAKTAAPGELRTSFRNVLDRSECDVDLRLPLRPRAGAGL